MIEFSDCDIFESGCDVLVNPVNCLGIGGKGLAKEFQKRFKANGAAYRDFCHRGRMIPGVLFKFGENPTIINFPTKAHWKDPSRLEDIQLGLTNLATMIAVTGIKSIAIPALGCGLGGLRWKKVKLLIETILASSNARIVVINPKTPTL